MKLTALLVFVTALAAGGPAWSDTVRHPTSAETWLAQRQAQEQQDDTRYRVCDAQRADNPATRSVDFTAAGRRCLIAALGQAASVQGTLVLLRNASVALRKNPADQALRKAAQGAVDRARVKLAADLPGLRERFKEDAAALDLAEFSIHLPQLHEQQQQWRLKTYLAASKASGQD
ncbi:hypothetical protein [Curvibacter sp. PAE-UM]|uniref:hypothetical protein n=1 Tax=Curvibacter sp. PAE-UM TaxID=1714344 RepID=UPI0007095CED|nr:hypothetical protein [Curvibacter sp. PAE-UM]KRI01454.1 hypothetical protein AO057_08435 [Curvibacter sp. PAE-UM]